MITTWLLTIMVCLLRVVSSGRSQAYPHLRLTRDLLDTGRYDKRVRPVRNVTSSVDVTMRFNLYQIVDVQERHQSVVVYMWVTQKWKDEFLGWSTFLYDDISTIVVPYSDIWLPDTYLYNSLKMERVASERHISVVVTTNDTSDGEPSANIRFMYPAMYEFTCSLNVLYFPFDKQNCTLVFGSWTNDMSGINYWAESNEVLQEGFVKSEEWDVESFSIARLEKAYSCCPHPYVMLNLSLVIQRKPLYYMINFVIPTAIITIVSVTGFFTPSASNAERYEKVNLGITTLLAMSILLLMVSDQMPATADFIPLIGWFYLWIIIMISTGTFLTTVIIVLEGRGKRGKPVPHLWRIIFFDFIAKLFFMPPPKDLLNCWEKGQCRNGRRDPSKENDEYQSPIKQNEGKLNNTTQHLNEKSSNHVEPSATAPEHSQTHQHAASVTPEDDGMIAFADDVDVAPLVRLVGANRRGLPSPPNKYTTTGVSPPPVNRPPPSSSVASDSRQKKSAAGDAGHRHLNNTTGCSNNNHKTDAADAIAKWTKISFDLSADRLASYAADVHGRERPSSQVGVDVKQKASTAASEAAAAASKEDVTDGLARARRLFRRATTLTKAQRGDGGDGEKRMERERRLAAEKTAVPLEWRYVAALLDRVLLVLFQTAVLGVTAVMLVATWLYW